MGQIEQIRRAHDSARPKPSNPAWCNCHQDCGVLLAEIERLQGAIKDWYDDPTRESCAALEAIGEEISLLAAWIEAH